MSELRRLRRILDEDLREYRQVCRDVKTETASREAARQNVAAAEQAQQALQQIVQSIQQTAHKRLAEVVSRCLQSVFDEPYEFYIHFERKRGKTEARLVFRRDGMELNPMRSSGGGVIDVAAFAMRLACLLFSQPQKRRLIVLDEPFRFLSSNYRPRIARMLDILSKEMNVQFILVTHMPEFEIGRVIHIQ